MLDHLKLINQLTLFTGISCLLAFFTREYPVFFYPVLLLRITVIGYCWFVMPRNYFTYVIIIALLLGWLGGYWDSFGGYFHGQNPKAP